MVELAEAPPLPPPPPLVIWEPVPDSSQEFAVDSRCDHTLYHGSRGPGKTSTQLMRFRMRVGLGYGSFWRGIIFDREFKNLSDIVAQSRRFFNAFKDGAKFLVAPADYKWVWPTGEELLFRHAKKSSDYDDYHGHEYAFVGYNELTKYPTSELFDKFMSINRSSFLGDKHTPRKPDGTYDTPDGQPLPPIPIELFATTNPNGPGHHWVKKRFISVAPMGEVFERKIKIFNPRTRKDEEITKTQVAIFGSYRENPYLPPEYIAELESITDPNLRAAWLKGSWDISAGGAFDDIWRASVHIKQRFKIPAGWIVDRSFDWGSTHPFHVGWWAEANGEEATLADGTVWCPPRGTLVLIDEWYGTVEIGTNKGLKLSAGDIADGIIDREIAMMDAGWIAVQPRPGPADNQIRDVRESDVETIEKKMADKGIRWTQSDKSAGSRINGFHLFRQRLEAAVRWEGPGIYYMSNCQGSITTIPTLPRDEKIMDDVDTDAEDHPYDGTRYRVLRSSNRLATKIKVTYPT